MSGVPNSVTAFRVFRPIEEGAPEMALHDEAETLEALSIPAPPYQIEAVSSDLSQVVEQD